MSQLAQVAPHESDGLSIRLSEQGVVVMAGKITSLDPSAAVQPYLRSLHAAALADKATQVLVDVRQLAFVNSSAIRLFIDWATWVKAVATPYKLVFMTDKAITWQRTSFVAIKSLAGAVIEVRS